MSNTKEPLNTEFGAVNDPQIIELIQEIDEILRQHKLAIVVHYRGETSTLYQIIKTNK